MLLCGEPGSTDALCPHCTTLSLAAHTISPLYVSRLGQTRLEWVEILHSMWFPLNLSNASLRLGISNRHNQQCANDLQLYMKTHCSLDGYMHKSGFPLSSVYVNISIFHFNILKIIWKLILNTRNLECREIEFHTSDLLTRTRKGQSATTLLADKINYKLKKGS